MMFKILAGMDLHPYLTEKESDGVFLLVGMDEYLKAAALMFDAPGVMWPPGVKERYPEALVEIVEKLLSRHRDRAGLQEVGYGIG